MQLLDERLILSASDLINHPECPHLTNLDLGVATGAFTLAEKRTDAVDLVGCKGDEHELAYVEWLRAGGREVVEITGDPGLDGLGRGAQRTLNAMRDGAEVIYQGAVFDGQPGAATPTFWSVSIRHRPWARGATRWPTPSSARRVKPYFPVAAGVLLRARRGGPGHGAGVGACRSRHAGAGELPSRRIRGVLPAHEVALRAGA